MELKPGYKQTEVGVIPEDWRNLPITKVARLESGHTPSRRNSNYWGGGVNWISLFDTQGLSRNEISTTEKTITAEGLNNSSARLLPAGTVVFSRTATVGKASIMATSMATSQDFANYICGPGLHNIFLVYLFRSMGRTWKNLMAGSIHNTIYMPTFKALKIVVPPLSEQKAIAQALSDADALIESLEQLLTKKRQIKQGAMQDLLTGVTRLPGFESTSELKRTELGLVPSDWSVIPLSQIAQCLIGLTYSPADVRPSGTLVLRSSNVQNGSLSYQDNVFVEMDIPPRVVTKEGDILVCVRNGSRQLIGKCAIIDKFGAGMAFGAFMAVLRSSEGIFLFQLFQSSFLKRQISVGMGATINQITNKDMASYKVIWPSLVDERNAIASTLSEMDSEIIAIETSLQKARKLKQGMMQELLTGRIRLV